MTNATPETQFVARCEPLPAQHATSARSRATGAQQITQRPGLKALALLALVRNNPRNMHATDSQTLRNKPLVSELDSLRDVSAAAGNDLRALLLRLAEVEGLDVDLIHRLPDADVAACEGLSAPTLTAYVRALADTDLRERGKAPPDETAAALCRRCGAVWVHPAVAAAAPVVNGWPCLLGCPWCHIRHAGGRVPRPPREP